MVNQATEERLERLRPHRIWRAMDQERRLKAAETLWKSEHVKPEELVAVVNAVAEARRFRPQSVRSAPPDRRSAYLAGSATIPDPVAATVLYVYHLEHQVALMSSFLDALGIEHENGRIEKEIEPPEPASLSKAIDAVLGQYDEKDVFTYMKTLVSQDQETWFGLLEVLESRGIE